MKKILTLGIVALVLVTMSSCQFNLFAAFDRIEIPSVAALSSKASTDPDGFVSDVEDYVENNFLENEDVTSAQVDQVVAELVTIYGTPPDVETGQQAAVLAGEIIINRDPVTAGVVNGVIGAVTDALAAGGTIDPDTLVDAIFPANLDLAGLQNILDDLDAAALAYADFAATISGAGTADWMTSGEVGDVVQLAVVAMVVSSIRAEGGVTDGDILTAIQGGTLPAIANPLEAAGGSTYATQLADMLAFAGLDLGI
jgi:hypothetical protein